MVSKESDLVPSNIVMEDYVKPAMEYYRVVLDKIAPYYFSDSLIKMVAFQQLVVTKNYKVARHDARKNKNVDFVKSCISRINKADDLVQLMSTWGAFDLCLTAPSFVNPVLAGNIRKGYCLVGQKFFDCHNCPKLACRNNVIWEKSTLMFDLDSDDGELANDFGKMHDAVEAMGVSYAIKLSSLGGLHLNIGLPRAGGSTIFDRNVYQYCVFRELRESGVQVDDNSLDPIPILRAPFSLHYRRLTPSLCVDPSALSRGIAALESIEALPLTKRIPLSTEVAKKWSLDWHVDNSPEDVFSVILKKWKDTAVQAIFREKERPVTRRTNVGVYLRKGTSMTTDDEHAALELLQDEGKSKELALKIIAMQKKKDPEYRESKVPEKEVLLETHGDVPRKIMEIPPPAVFLVIDNASASDMQEITGTMPIKVKTACKNTDEGMGLLFKESGLLKRYGPRWNCKTAFIGGLYVAYNYCGAADLVVAVKMESVWDRDMKILDEMDKLMQECPGDLIVAHLLGLDFCKDNGFDPSGALLTFKKIVKSVLETGSNLAMTSDHSGEDHVPYFEIVNIERKEPSAESP
nr:hypothetical protein [Candidatus Sigynarchaeota archaeon]